TIAITGLVFAAFTATRAPFAACLAVTLTLGLVAVALSGRVASAPAPRAGAETWGSGERMRVVVNYELGDEHRGAGGLAVPRLEHPDAHAPAGHVDEPRVGRARAGPGPHRKRRGARPGPARAGLPDDALVDTHTDPSHARAVLAELLPERDDELDVRARRRRGRDDRGAREVRGAQLVEAREREHGVRVAEVDAQCGAHDVEAVHAHLGVEARRDRLRAAWDRPGAHVDRVPAGGLASH